MSNEPKIPFVAAMSALTKKSYETCLNTYNEMSPSERIMSEESYLENNMGYGPEAWAAYKSAQAEQEASRR